MELKDFNELCEYINSNSREDLIRSIYQYILLDNNYYGKFDVGLDILQSVLEKEYNFQYCNSIIDEVTDIKENIHQYMDLYNNQFLDETSKRVLFHLLAYRITRSKSRLYLAYCGDSRQYFDSRITKYKEDCVYVDCGGLDAKNAVEFALECPSYKHIYIYEPIRDYYLDCIKNIKDLGLDNVTIRNSAVYSKKTNLYFDIAKKGSSRMAEQGKTEVSAVSLDEDIGEPIGFLKMDIEGAEKQAISGSRRHIKEDNPYLAVCVYHLPGDIWEIANQILSINSNYNLYLRHHRIDPNETVLYAVPKEEYPSKTIESQTKSYKDFVAELSKYEIDITTNELLYLYQQLENHKIALRSSEKVVGELKEWTQKLTEAKEWISQQYENCKIENERKDKLIEESAKHVKRKHEKVSD